MYWRTLKIVTVVALLASPSAFAAQNGMVNPNGATSIRDAAPQILLAEHSHGQRGDIRGDGPRRFGGQPARQFRPYPAPRFGGHPPRHFRGYPRRHFRGYPPRRYFRPWRRNY